MESALARQVDLNRQKGDFVATVSHELRTPLAVMLAANHTLRKLADRIPETKRLELLDASIEQGNRLQRLIDELLLVAAAEHESVDVRTGAIELEPLIAEIETELAMEDFKRRTGTDIQHVPYRGSTPGVDYFHNASARRARSGE